jgi:hypothetical protein
MADVGLAPFLIIYLAIAVQMAVFVASSWAIARALGARVTEISLGGRLVRVRVGGVSVQLGVWPSAWVQLAGRAPDDNDQEPGSWRRLGRGARVAIIAGPWLVTLALAAACLGPAHAARSVAHGVAQVFFVLDLTPLVRQVLHLIAHAPLAVAIGVVLAKAIAVNLAPLPGLGGGAILAALRRDGGTAKPGGWGMAAFLLVTLYMLGRFGWALVHVIVG